jgi:hypothetical protein
MLLSLHLLHESLPWAVTIRPGKESRDERAWQDKVIHPPHLVRPGHFTRCRQPAARPVLSRFSSPETARGLVFLKPWSPPSTVPGNAPVYFHSLGFSLCPAPANCVLALGAFSCDVCMLCSNRPALSTRRARWGTRLGYGGNKRGTRIPGHGHGGTEYAGVRNARHSIDVAAPMDASDCVHCCRCCSHGGVGLRPACSRRCRRYTAGQ